MSSTSINEAQPTCPKCGYGQPWIVEVRGVYDGGLYWECPSCHHMWPRFPAGTKLHRIALEMIKGRTK
jgi:ssDNA-binding Zn-finger/Zn-ribbon topoisomerase 1